ncbi:hypothetical protein LSH36_413g00041 [Paralvinella palmiformis]|uniref:DUF7402 domain-containing protein n=1 Tax=Paralvinella palmiformis TaxID=53620 RepID=A0AAD9JCJ7_9ANNE|nr:hypothetical protein LSH36_413g00041 [Paralvinella palmiformis]
MFKASRSVIEQMDIDNSLDTGQITFTHIAIRPPSSGILQSRIILILFGIAPKAEIILQLVEHKLAIQSCTSGSIEDSKYLCDYAFDGRLDPGDYKEWSADIEDEAPWIQLTFESAVMVDVIKLWWRCAGESQFSRLVFNFSDGSSQMVTHQCSNETDWLGCSASDPEEVFYINPVLTTYITINGIDCILKKGNNGFREVEFWDS